MSFRREYYLEIFAKHQGIVEVTCFYLGNKYVLRIYYLLDTVNSPGTSRGK